MLKAAPAATPARADHPLVRSVQRRTVALLVAAALLNYFDRTALAVANPLIRADLHLSVEQMGLLLSALMWAYAFAQLPIGAVIDRTGPKRALGVGLVLWSAAQAVGGLMRGFGPFVAVRALLGLGESPMFPAAAAAVRDWFRIGQRTSITGIWNSAPAVAQALAPPILTVMMTALGWRWMFIVLGLAGVVLAGVWTLGYRDRRRHAPPPAAQTDVGGWARLFRHRMTWGLMAGNFGVIYVLYLYSTWLPGYLEIERGLSIRSAGLWTALPFALSISGSIGGGFLVDHLSRRGVPLLRAQKAFVAVSLVGMALFTFAAAHAPNLGWAIADISAALCCDGCATCMAWAIATTAAPKGFVGSIGSIQNFAGYVGGALAPMVTGFIVQATGHFTLALVTAAVIALLSAASYVLLVPREPMRLA
jgi:MFS family permease